VTAPAYGELAALVVILQARIAEQDAPIPELERQLAASSRNSSKPPSAEGLGKPAPKSLRSRSGRKPCGQPGHEGRTLTEIPWRTGLRSRDDREDTRRRPTAGGDMGVTHPGLTRQHRTRS
jgi:hypothetical protein